MTLVRVGERGVDFSFARPPADRLLELGFTFVVGYISVPPASPNKNLTRAEIEAYREAGLAVGLVWEMDAARPNKGATYGEIDGRNARLEAVKRDWPMDLPIITACDLNSFADNIDRHEMYVRGFHKTVEQEWIGIYGDTDILARTVGVWNIGWVPIGAWAWSGTSKADAIARAKAVGAHVLQSKGYYIDNVWAVDPNDVINDFPAWGPDSVFPPPPPPPPQGDDMPALVTNSTGTTVWIIRDDNGFRRQISPQELRARGGVVNVVWSDEELAQVPEYVGPPGSEIDLTALAAALAPLLPVTDEVARDMAARNANSISDIRMGGQRIADAGGH